MRPRTRRPQDRDKRKEQRTRSSVREERELDALQIEEYIATNVVSNHQNRQRDRQTRKLLQTVLSAADLLRAAGIEADGNDTAGKVKLAIAKLTKGQGTDSLR